MQTIEFRRFEIRPGARILDVGCGSGRHLAGALSLARVRLNGVDRSLQDLAKARERLELHRRLGQDGNGCWSLAAADITALPFEDGLFDGVICSEVLEHIQDDTRAIREVLRVLKPKGVLALSVPRFWPEKVCWRLSTAYRTEKGGHIRIYRRRQLIRHVQDAGSRFIGRHFAHALHSPFWWLKCLTGLRVEEPLLVRLYHRFLVWDLTTRPPLVRGLERLLNPLLGKSDVLYFRKNRD